MNSVDPALRQLTFKGFQDMTTATREAYLEVLLHDANLDYNFIEHIYTGPKDNQTLTGISFVDFSSKRAAADALKKLGGKGKELHVSDTCSVIVKPAITAINLKRNGCLRAAHKLIKEDSKSKNKEVKLDFLSRKMTVDGRDTIS